jgi:hypothetical protein
MVMGLMNHPEREKFNYPVAVPGGCCGCGDEVPELFYHGYADKGAAIALCRRCAHQLARKILEDLCDLDGDRYG